MDANVDPNIEEQPLEPVEEFPLPPVPPVANPFALTPYQTYGGIVDYFT